MTSDSPSDSARWRAIQQPGYYESVEAPRPLAPSATGRDLEAVFLDSQSRLDIDQQTHKLPSLAGSYPDASTYHSGLHQRHSPADGKYGPQHPVSFPEQRSAWHSLRYDYDDRGNERQIIDAPLTLHIPKTQDLPETSNGNISTASESHLSNVYSSMTQQTTTLPSFASLQEQAGRDNESMEADIAPMSAQMLCRSCTTLKPLVRDVAVSVCELDQIIQKSCNKLITRTSDFPTDSPVHAAHWTLDRLQRAKEDLRATFQGNQPNYGYQQVSSTDLPPRNMSPPNVLKRTADRWDHDEGPYPKRPRSGPSPVEAQRNTNITSRDNRRASIDFITSDQYHRPGYSPIGTDSIPGSAYPKTVSPGRPSRNLPSPSSIAYPPSAAPSLALQTAQSVGSPTASYQPAVSIHTASTDSATSAHIADLQHQVTLKSLTLETLQREYASLLQKIQRLNVKTQTMERKSTVADQEVNELTAKNEDLVQQVQSLQDQLDESEKRREKAREESVREKDQWLQMLEQGRRIQGKYDDDKKALSQHITALEEEKQRLRMESDLRLPTPRGDQETMEDKMRGGNESSKATVGSVGNDLTEVAALKAKINVLRSSLADAKRHNEALDERARGILHQSAQLDGVIDRALGDEVSSEARTAELDQGNADTETQQQGSREECSPTFSTNQASSTGTLEKSLAPAESAWSLPQAPSRGPSESRPQLKPSEFAVGSQMKSNSNERNTLRMSVNESRANLANAQRGDDLVRSREVEQSMGQSSSAWMKLETDRPREDSETSRIGCFRRYTYHSFIPHAEQSRTPTRAPTPPHSPDRRSSTSTLWDNGKSPEESGPQSGADLTPVSTLPTPTSASSTQQVGVGESNGSYFYRTQNSSEEMSENMPPPPRPSLYGVEYNSSGSNSSR